MPTIQRHTCDPISHHGTTKHSKHSSPNADPPPPRASPPSGRRGGPRPQVGRSRRGRGRDLGPTAAGGLFRPIPSVRRCSRGPARTVSSASTQGLRATHPRQRLRVRTPPRPSETVATTAPCSSSPREGMATASGVPTGPVLPLPSLRTRRSAVSPVRALAPRCNARDVFTLTLVKC
jgi:hypothetical protein